MKKKSPRGIPDFSRQGTPPKGKRSAEPDGQQGKSKRPLGGQAPRTKPQSTSSKSGQRGT